MKKIFGFSIIFCALALTSCKQDVELLFDQSAAERLNAVSDSYSAKLQASSNGWAMQLYPTTEDEAPYGSGYLVLLRFNKDMSVTASMQNVLSSGKYLESTSAWQVISDNGPVLSFATYNEVIHRFSNPDAYKTSTSVGQSHGDGTGIGGDYEYIVVDAPDDASYVMLKGKKRGTYNLMTPIEEGVDYESYLADVMNFHNECFPAAMKNAGTANEDSVIVYNPSNLLHFGETIYKFEEGHGGVPAMYPYGGDKVTQSIFNPFLISKNGNDYHMRFRDEFDINGVKMQDLVYNQEKDVFESKDDASCYLEGGKPSDQLKSSLNSGKVWQTNSKSTMTESYKTIYDGMATEFSALKYSLVRMTFTKKDGKFIATAYVKNAKGASTSIPYYFEIVSLDESSFKLKYSSTTTVGENILAKVPSIASLFDRMNTMKKVDYVVTRFNLASLKLVDEGNEYFVINLEKDLNK